MPDLIAGMPFEVDHILAVKHGGKTEISNLAYACLRCNRCKGTDFATFLSVQKEPVLFFNPRNDFWFDHFESISGHIYAKTPIGEATLKIFQLNFPIERLMIRQVLELENLFP
jgi:HNH endonuclease